MGVCLKSDFVCEVCFLFCHTVAVVMGLSHFLILSVDWLPDVPLLLSFPNFSLQFQRFSSLNYGLSLSLTVSSVSLLCLSTFIVRLHLFSPSCLSCSASACTSVSICPHDCILAHFLHLSLKSPYVSLALTTSLGGLWGGSC